MSAPLSDLLDAARRGHALGQAIAAAGGPDLRITGCLQTGSRASTHAGTLGGRAVVVKQFHGPDAAGIARRLDAELAHLAGHMAHGPYRFAACLAAYPEHGAAILERVPGTRMDAVLALAGLERRAALLADCGAWLRHYSAGRRETGRFGPRYWLKQRRDDPRAADLPPEAAALRTALLDALEQMAPAAADAAITKADTHGDFTPMNLHLDGTTIHGFDSQARTRMPLARDAARFLVTLHRADPHRPQALRHGLPEADVAALAEGALPDAPDREIALPFFIGEQIALHLPGHRQSPARAARIYAMARACIEAAPCP